MSSLIDMITNNPQIVNTIAKQAGINIDDAGSVIGKLAPILMGSAKSNIQSERDSGTLLDQIKDLQFSDMLDKPEESLGRSDIKDIGNSILAQLTGSKENSREVATHVEEQTGVSSSIIKSILPMLAPLVIGAITKRAQPQMQQAPSNDHGMLGNLITGMIDQDHDGSMIDDIMGMAMRKFFS